MGESRKLCCRIFEFFNICFNDHKTQDGGLLFSSFKLNYTSFLLIGCFFIYLVSLVSLCGGGFGYRSYAVFLTNFSADMKCGR